MAREALIQNENIVDAFIGSTTIVYLPANATMSEELARAAVKGTKLKFDGEFKKVDVTLF